MDAIDTRVIELLGRNILATDLLRGGVELAIPMRDNGIDLIAYLDEPQDFHACPVQLKAASRGYFSIDRKYERIPGLLLAYVWHVNDKQQPQIFAMTYEEAFRIADELGWTKSISWTRDGKCVANSPSSELVTKLERYSMNKQAWVDLVRRSAPKNAA